MAKVSTKTTETNANGNTSSKGALTVPTGKSIQSGIGLKVLDALFGTYKDEQQIAKMQESVVYRKNEAQSLVTLALYNAMKAEPRAVHLATASFKDDRAKQEQSNDWFKGCLEIVTFKTDPETGKMVAEETDEVKKRFGDGQPKGSAAYTRGQYARKNFSTFLKNAMKNAVGMFDLEIESVKIDEKSKALQITGLKVQELFGQGVVVLNSASSEQGLKDDAPEASLKTVREIAAKKHGSKPDTKSVTAETSTKGTEVPDGDVQAAVRSVAASFIGLINKLEGKVDEDTRKSILSVANAIRAYLPELNPAPRATDVARSDVGKVTLAKSAASEVNANGKRAKRTN